MMQNAEPASLVSVKFDSVVRVRCFLSGHVDFAPPLQPGEAVVVDEGACSRSGSACSSGCSAGGCDGCRNS